MTLRHLCSTLFLGLFLSTVSAQALPVVQNPNFNQGPAGAQFDGWTLQGDGLTEAGPGQTDIPTGVGNNVAVLSSTGGPADQATAEAALSLDAGALDSTNGFPYNFIITNGAVLTQVNTSGFTGDQIFFDARFMVDDGAGGGEPGQGEPGQGGPNGNGFDVSFAVLADPLAGGSADQILMIGSGAGNQLPFANFSFTLLRDATVGNPLLLGFGVFNTDDTSVDSRLGIANILGVANNAPAGVPEIDASSAVMPVAINLITLILLSDRRRRQV